jgi:PAS domain S-box-containing protein
MSGDRGTHISIDEQTANSGWSNELLLKELTDVAVFSVDVDLRITSWSPGVEHLLGYSKSDFIRQNVSFIFTPEDREQRIDQLEFEKARQRGRSSDIRWHLKKDGSRIFVDGILNAVRRGNGSITGYVKIIRDVFPDRERQRVMAALLDETPEAISIKDRQGRYAFVNSTFARTLGKPIAEIVGREIGDFLPASMSNPIRNDDNACITLRTPHVVEEPFLSADQGPRTFLSGKAPLNNLEGNTVGVVCISQDITARKQHERERERLVRELRRSNEDLVQFSYVVSHDLQAPLRTIRSFTELLVQKHNQKLDEEAREFLSLIVAGAQNMEQIIQALLRYAQAGEEPIMQEPVSMEAVLAGARLNLQALINEKGAEITNSPLPTVRGDPTLLLQLLQNLIGNALKYSRSGVTPRIELSARQLSETVYEFSVRDNGIGISPENLDLIFAPLKRLHGQEVAGTGIGLAICKKIVERHGGRIWVESRPGEGSTFYFTLTAQ